MQVPTLAELGVKDAVSNTFQALFAPAGTSPEIISFLSQQCVNALKEPDVVEKLKQAGLATTALDSAGLRARVAREVPYWRDVIEKGGIKGE
jgi:tripartite-type tricarboxylate transporter receptor subunit TctC